MRQFVPSAKGSQMAVANGASTALAVAAPFYQIHNPLANAAHALMGVSTSVADATCFVIPSGETAIIARGAASHLTVFSTSTGNVLAVPGQMV